MVKSFKLLVLATLFIIGLSMIIFQDQIFFGYFVYWWLLITFIYLIRFLHINSKFFFHLAFTLFIIAGLLTTTGFYNIAEPMMRLSFIGWIVYLTQALIEYKSVRAP